MITNQVEGSNSAVVVPLLIVGGGRTGTTLLMQLLGTSPLVAFDRTYPFEVRYLTYLTRWAHLLREDASAHPGWAAGYETLLPGASPVGGFPYAEAALWDGQALWDRALPAVWAAFSGQLSERLPGKDVAGPRYYAEKVPYWLPAVLDGRIACRQLVSVRDPRDMFLSISAFNRKRGFAAFGRTATDDDWTFARRFAAEIKNQFPSVRSACEAENSVLVRYEDLAGGFPAAAARLSTWLSIELDHQTVLEQAADFAAHMTSLTPEDSIARWKRELPSDLNEFFTGELSQELRYFAYET